MSDDLRKSLEEMVKKLGSDLGLPKVDVDKLVETHQKNFDALIEAAKAASASVKRVADQQRELIESTLNDAVALAQHLKPGADAATLMTQQREAVSRVVDKTSSSTSAIAEQIQSLNNEVWKIVTDRLAASAGELRASFQRGAVAPKSEP
jgi:phasin family protein